jgi:hypothetical protein
MGNFILALRTLLQLVPTILELIKAVEVPGFGVEKLETVIGLVLAAFDVLPDEVRKLIPVDTVKLFITKAVAVIIAFYNAVGIFKRST